MSTVTTRTLPGIDRPRSRPVEWLKAHPLAADSVLAAANVALGIVSFVVAVDPATVNAFADPGVKQGSLDGLRRGRPGGCPRRSPPSTAGGWGTPCPRRSPREPAT